MVELDNLHRLALENAAAVKSFKKRFAYDELKRLLGERADARGKRASILLPGVRGVGKTTLMLQLFNESSEAFYFSADSILARASSVYAIVEQAFRSGHETIFIDEIHKYPKWVEELKNVYDDFSVRIVASGSSAAAIKKGCIALGRRALEVPVSFLTFGEFVYLMEGEKITAGIEDVFDRKSKVKWLAQHPAAGKHYSAYLSTGGFPSLSSEKIGVFKLVKRMIYEDALAEFSLTENKVDACERLLGFLSLSKAGNFSYTSFSSTSGYAKSTVYEAVVMLKELDILRSVKQDSPKAQAKEIMKLLFSHPNLRAAFAEQLMKEADVGALREEYFLFHAANLNLPVSIPKGMKKNPDYEIAFDDGKKLVEVGGSSKTNKQFEGREGTILDDEALQMLGFVQKASRV